MVLPSFQVLIPSSLQEALDMLDGHPDARLLAGGTDLLVDLRPAVIRSAPFVPQGYADEWGIGYQQEPSGPLVSLHGLEQLRGLRSLTSHVRAGATTTVAELASSPLLRKHLTALAEGAAALGTPLVRNRGTYGGNICNARPAADTLVPTVALGGTLHLAHKNSTRKVSVVDFVLGPGRIALRAGELLTHIQLPFFPRQGSAYLKLGTRKALEIAQVGVAASVVLDQAGRVVHSGVALGAVGPTPILCHGTAESLHGHVPDQAAIRAASLAARREAAPISDHRASREYRLEMVQLLTRRALTRAVERARSAAAPGEQS